MAMQTIMKSHHMMIHMYARLNQKTINNNTSCLHTYIASHGGRYILHDIDLNLQLEGK